MGNTVTNSDLKFMIKTKCIGVLLKLISFEESEFHLLD